MQETLASRRMNLVLQPLYQIDLEYTPQYAIVHLPRVDKLTKGVYLEMREKFEEIFFLVDTLGYPALHAAIWQNDTTLARFAEKMGFMKVGSDQGMDIYEFIGVE